MPREQVTDSLFQRRASFLVPTPEPQEAEGARLVDAGRHHLAILKRSFFGAHLDYEADVGIDALEQPTVGSRQRSLPRLRVQRPVGAERGRSSSSPLAAEAAHRRLRRDHAELERRLAVAVRALGALTEGMDGDGIAEDGGEAALGC